MNLRVTHIGAATMLLEVGTLRLLTDPVFDPAGAEYGFGYGTRSRKIVGPAVAASTVGPIDAVLLSHDHHADNLDAAGRALLPHAGRVITTVSGAARLRGGATGVNAAGLHPGQQTRVPGPDGFSILVTATPARHGPPLSRPFVGAVIGFLLEWEGMSDGAVYITGDTVWFAGLRDAMKGRRIGTAFYHLGKASFASTGPIRYTMNTRDALQLTEAIRPARVVPIHYEGFSHFAEGRRQVESTFAAAGKADLLRWLPMGEATELEV